MASASTAFSVVALRAEIDLREQGGRRVTPTPTPPFIAYTTFHGPAATVFRNWLKPRSGLAAPSESELAGVSGRSGQSCSRPQLDVAWAPAPGTTNVSSSCAVGLAACAAFMPQQGLRHLASTTPAGAGLREYLVGVEAVLCAQRLRRAPRAATAISGFIYWAIPILEFAAPPREARHSSFTHPSAGPHDPR